MNEPFRIALRLTMLSDWHVGTGAGRPGSVDRLVARDDDGLPFVPAKTLTGIWRDACERLAAGLDGDPTGASAGGGATWTAWVEQIFGDQPGLLGDRDSLPEAIRPRPALLEVREARMPAALVAVLRTEPGAAAEPGRHSLREALTFVKPGVKIDPLTGRAQDDHLRFIEMARVDAVLESVVELAVVDADREAALALLVAGGLLVERIGGKRRRGAGRCRLSLTGPGVPTATKAIEWLAAHEPPTRATGSATPGPALMGETTAIADAGWLSLAYEVRLESPLIVSARKVGNVLETLDHIPGTLLLPHVTRALATLSLDARDAISRGDLRVLPATIAMESAAGRAVPFALHRPKHGPAGGRQTADDVVNLLESQADPATQLKQFRVGYVGRRSQGAAMEHATVRIVTRTHNVVEDARQRPTAEVGGVYTYEAIAPATFRGAILVRRSLWQAVAARPGWREALSGRCRLGRSKKDDYGAAVVTIVGEPATPPAPQAAPAAGGRLVVWLLSDALLRDERLRPDPSAERLRLALRAALDPDGSRGIGLTLHPSRQSAFCRVRRTESWQQSWGLPRPSLVGLQAGSCVAFSVEGVVTADDLARIEAAGIGERTAEGYGQVSFNDPLLQAASVAFLPVASADGRTAGTAATGSALIGPNQPDHAFARRIEEQAWREEIRRAALTQAANFEDLLHWGRTRNAKPAMSQLGGLRAALSHVTTAHGAKHAIGWIDHLRKNSSRSKGWPTNSLETIRRLLDDKDAVWQVLGCSGGDGSRWPTLTTDGAEALRKKLWPIAVRSFLQAAIRACKRSRDTASRSRAKAEET